MSMDIMDILSRYIDSEQFDSHYYDDEVTEQILYDLILPSRIPIDQSINTMSRVQAVIDILTRIHESIPKNSTEFSPYEGLAALSHWPNTDESAEEIYHFNYMGEYSMILKVSKDSDYDSMMREYSVGQVMNNLRSTIPAFVYTYGYVSDVLLYYPRNKSGGYCLQRSPGQHCILLEYLYSSMPLTDLEPGVTTATVLKNDGRTMVYEDEDLIRLILFQVFCALSYAHYSVGFVHGNLTLNNIMLVRLPVIMTVPVMIPVLYGRMITFEMRWIVSDVMIVIRDFSTATVRHEGSKELDSDILHLINTMSEPVKNYIADERRWKSIESDFIEIQNDIQNKDHYAAVVQFCNKYSSMFISTDTSVYTSVLTVQNDRQSIDSIRIDNAQKFYWYDRYYDILGYLPLHTESIESDRWYREKMIDPLLSTAVYDNDRLTNDLVYEAVHYENGMTVMINTALLLYRYTSHFSSFRLNILPFKYDDPEDLLRDADEYISGGVTFDHDAAVTVQIIDRILND